MSQRTPSARSSRRRARRLPSCGRNRSPVRLGEPRWDRGLYAAPLFRPHHFGHARSQGEERRVELHVLVDPTDLAGGGAAWAAIGSEAEPTQATAQGVYLNDIEDGPEVIGAFSPQAGKSPGRKIADVLERRPIEALAPSTITAILRSHGVEIGDHGRGSKPFEHAAPNDLWQMDFKGHVGMADGRRLHPRPFSTTICPIAWRWAPPRTSDATVQGFLTAAFRRYGLQRTLITDNGAPDLEAASRKLARSREVYNRERPHEGICMPVPAERYAASSREYQERIEPLFYALSDALRQVQPGGRISLAGRQLRVPKAFAPRENALRATNHDGLYEFLYRHQRIALLHFRAGKGDTQPVNHVSEQVSTISPV